jgi:type II secretory pathway component GspD/PulD (secretin)
MPSAPALPSSGPVPIVFTNTDVSDVLLAVSRAFRANIVFPAQMKKAISLNVKVRTVEEALRNITAAAEMSFRQIGETYIVAPPAALRHAVEPFGLRERVNLNILTPPEAVALLEGALPYLTARPAGTQVLLIGAPEDIEQARAILREQDPPRPPDPPTPEVVTLRYAQANQVAIMLRNLYPGLKADAVGPTDRPGGAIGLYGPKSQVRGAVETVRTVDVPTAPGEPEREYRVYTIKYSSAPILKEFLQESAPTVSVVIGPESYSPPMPGFRPLSGASLGTSSIGGGLFGGRGGGGLGGGLGGVGGAQAGGAFGLGLGGQEQRRAREGDRSKILVLSGTPSELDAAFRLLEKVDIPPKQVMVAVKVVDTSPERAEELGLRWNWEPFQFLEQPAGTAVAPDTGRPLAKVTRPPAFGQISRVPWGFNAILSAMITRKEAKLLADPRIQVVDNDDANIFIGDTIRARIAQASALGAQTIDIVEFPVGIILLVRPRVNADGNITLRIHPVVSTITAVDANNVPQTSSREAETTVMVKDGETVVIGGLIRDELSKTVQEVPILSKLPLVGELFRNRSTAHRHSEILVFITPYIVK